MKRTENTTFADLLKDFADSYKRQTKDPQRYADTLQELAQACASSVLKKVIDPTRHSDSDKAANSGFNPALVQMRRDMFLGKIALDNLRYSTDNSSAIVYNDDGELVQTVTDKALAKAAEKLIHENLQDGLDLVQEAACAILEEVAKQQEREPRKPIDLERPYTVKRLKKRVWIKTADSVNGWEEAETTPIQEVYKAIRRAIQASRAMQTDPRNGYSYLEDTTTDPTTGETVEIYKRLPKWADLGGTVTDRPFSDMAGAPAGYNSSGNGLYMADGQTAADYESILAALNLTDRQRKIIEMRLQGYGARAIGTALGIRLFAVQDLLSRVAKKAENIGFTPQMWEEMTATA